MIKYSLSQVASLATIVMATTEKRELRRRVPLNSPSQQRELLATGASNFRMKVIKRDKINRPNQTAILLWPTATNLVLRTAGFYFLFHYCATIVKTFLKEFHFYA